MFRFGRRHPEPRMPFAGRYLTRLVVLSGFSVFAMAVLDLSHFRENAAAHRSEKDTGSKVVASIQTALPPSPFAELGLGVFIADDQPKQPNPQSHESSSEKQSQADDLPKPDQQLLENVLDKTSGLPTRAYYHLATLAAQAPLDLLEKHARRDVRFANLWNEPELFRGELVHLKGHLRGGLKPFQPSDNEFFNPAKIESLYEGYLFTDDSRHNPYVIIVPSIPPGMPTNQDSAENITFAGYFLKLYAYNSRDNLQRASPLLIGRMLTWTPAPRVDQTSHLSMVLAGAFIVLVMAVGGAIWILNRGGLRHGQRALTAGIQADEKALASLAQLEKLDVPDPLQKLAELGEYSSQTE